MVTSSSSSPSLLVHLCCSWQTGAPEEQVLTLSAGSTVQEALAHAQVKNSCTLGMAQVLQHLPQHLSQGWALGIFGKKCNANTLLHSGDRLEIYRPLRVDPKVARRERFSQQGSAQSAGLFAARRSRHQQTSNG